MAVTLVPDDLIQPDGELTAALFPDDDLIEFVAGWLDQATTKVEAASGISSSSQDAAAAAWVYYRAYNYVAQRLVAGPASHRLGPAEETYEQDQRSYFAGLAAQKLAEYTGFDSTVTPMGALFAVARAGRVTYCD